MPLLRKIITIDEDKCDGCGECVPACPEGAIAIIDGKAKLVSEIYCDGLGACLGDCPQGAITMEEREAEAFDEEAVRRRIEDQKPSPVVASPQPGAAPVPPGGGCPGAAARAITREQPAGRPYESPGGAPPVSTLGNWPVQLHLVPVQAPYLRGARLLIAADCVPFAFADFHRRLLAGRTLLIACPKLDDVEAYRQKLGALFLENEIESVDVAYMEVPCCFGLVHVVRTALEELEESGRNIPLNLIKVGIKGDVLEATPAPASGPPARKPA